MPLETTFSTQLGSLRDPEQFQAALSLPHSERESWISFLKRMLLIRKVEEHISKNVANGNIKCPCHLSIGQEAIAVGITHYLRATDKIFGTHRSHALFLALGGKPYSLFAEVLGKNSGCSHGMGGSMHLKLVEKGFLGSVPIVAATIPLAVGAALAAKKEGQGNLGVCFFGDGAAEEGVLHESLNYAAKFKLPVLFVCENNLFSSHVHIDLRQASDSISRFAKAHGIRHFLIDGNDIAAIESTTQEAVPSIREGNGPCLIEAVTYRWKGHVGHRDDLDVGVERHRELAEWKKRDPIERLLKALIARNWFTEAEMLETEREIEKALDFDWNQAYESPYPAPSNLLDRVFSTPPTYEN